MAGPATRRTRRAVVETPPSASNDGTLMDVSQDDMSINGLEQCDSRVQEDNAAQASSSHDEIAPLGANVIEALRVVSKLEQLGLDKQEISLPKCVVLGQQSTGKSSVIEAISGIKTPRDTGTCTRCPLFIELQPSANPRDSWHAKIDLQCQYKLDCDPDRDAVDPEFQGWIPLPVQTTTPFAQTTNRDELEHLIRCAQRATLSPLVNPENFLDPTFNDEAYHKSLFSPNVVSISVSKPGLPPLSFYDLPGVISFAENEEEEFTVDLVKRLVTKYIKDPEALILLTCPLETDVANSVAAGLATRANVKDRCLGVLTKPDRLPVGESPQNLINIFENHHFAMGHGYFAVKNLNSDEIREGLTHLDARRLENAFFATVEPWSTTLKAYSHRFGTVHLQKFLSRHLGNQVLLKLPIIRHQIEDRLAAIERELSRIPDIPIHTAARTVNDVIQAFTDDVRCEMLGEHRFTTWRNIWDEIRRNMWDMLTQLKPTMSVTGQRDEGLFFTTLPGGTPDQSIVIDSDDDADMSSAPETPSKKRKYNIAPKREAKTPAPGPSPKRTPKKPANGLARPQSSRTSRPQPDNMAALRKSFNLDEVSQYISQNSKIRMPGQIDPKVCDEMMLSTLEHWPQVVNKFFDELEHHLKQHILSVFNSRFKDWKSSPLYTESLAIVESLLMNNISEQRTTMSSNSLSDEKEGPYIFHEEVFKKDKEAVLDRYTQARLRARLRIFINEAASSQGRDLSLAEQERMKKDEQKMAIIKAEPYKREIELVADITTYYMTAARRFHDSIMMRIESKFFKQLRTELSKEMQDVLGIYDDPEGPYNAQRLLAHSSDQITRRTILTAKKDALLNGLSCLNDHEHGHVQKDQHGYERRSSGAAAGAGRDRVVDMQDVNMAGDVFSRDLPVRAVSRALV